MTRIDGSGNPFSAGFSDQCTYWSQKRYHDLTNIWTPCTGNGYQWATQAASNGWFVSSQPPQEQPSIICLQPNVQGADRNFGHVGVVERINLDNTVYTSNYNVAPHIGDKIVVYKTFQIGNGVSFIYADIGVGHANIPVAITSIQNGVIFLSKTYSLSQNDTVLNFLQSLDEQLVLVDPFNISVDGLDIVGWLNQFGSNIWRDFKAIIARGLFIAIGLYLLFQVLSHFVDFSQIGSGISSAMKRRRI